MLNSSDGFEDVAFHYNFQFWKQPKITLSEIRRTGKMIKSGNWSACQKLTNTERWVLHAPEHCHGTKPNLLTIDVAFLVVQLPEVTSKCPHMRVFEFTDRGSLLNELTADDSPDAKKQTSIVLICERNFRACLDFGDYGKQHCVLYLLVSWSYW